ncbi:MAG: hypothetical protein ABI896_06650 [Actinomycetota bacterium]
MNTFQTAFSSARFNRYMLWLGSGVLAVGVVVLLFAFVKGSDKTSFGPEQGFRAQLPEHSTPLKNANGVTVRTFYQLDPEVRTTIRTFLATAVSRKHLEDSWTVIAPSVKKGYTLASWSHAKALPVIPYPIEDVSKSQYYLDYASTREILIEVGVSAAPKYKLRSTAFQLGLVPVGAGANQHWLVDYWMPRWTPPLPAN